MEKKYEFFKLRNLYADKELKKDKDKSNLYNKKFKIKRKSSRYSLKIRNKNYETFGEIIDFIKKIFYKILMNLLKTKKKML